MLTVGFRVPVLCLSMACSLVVILMVVLRTLMVLLVAFNGPVEFLSVLVVFEFPLDLLGLLDIVMLNVEELKDELMQLKASELLA